MSIVVQKYGGSSVADVNKIRQVAERVMQTKRAGHDVVVVVSAMGKTTDGLLALAREVSPSPPRRELDMLVSTGERVSMALLSMAIQKRGCDAISFTGSQSGIITNDRHFDARIIEVRPHRVEDELARGRVVIVAGYQGMSYKREITTLGRGGSDTTAIAMAAALGAERAEIYSDVDGVYSADPRVVPDAKHLPELSYEAMQEMAEAGAKVLNAAAVEFAKRAKITIHARATFSPGRETVVREAATNGAARAVVGQRGLVRVSVQGDHAVLDRALAIAEQGGVAAHDVEADRTGGAFLVATLHAPGFGAVRTEIEGALAGAARFEDGVAMVSFVGDLRAHARPIARELLRVLGDASIVPHRMATTALRVSALVDEASVDRAVQAVHRALVNDP